MPALRILHLTGSTSDDFHCNLSCYFGHSCLVNLANPSLYDFQIAYVTPDGQWRFPVSLSEEDIAAAKSMSLTDAIKVLTTQNIDLVLPQMYCTPGMTHYRALFDLLRIPYIGNTPAVMAIAGHKARAKAIVAAAGVKVPFGQLLRQGDVPTITPPAVVKPASADNSFGISFVKVPADYDAALKKAFEHSEEVIVEEFIEPGREVRCGVIVKDGKLIGLPLEEYLIDAKEIPIRDHAQKHQLAHGYNMYSISTDTTPTRWIVDVTDPMTQKVQQVAKTCHVVLGCRHYSLFDFRIDPVGEVWFLEAGLYCSFGNHSVIARTAKSAGIPLHQLFITAINEALNQASNV